MSVTGSLALFRVDGDTESNVLADTVVNGDLFVYSLNLSAGEMDLTFDGGTVHLQSGDGKSFALAWLESSAVSWHGER